MGDPVSEGPASAGFFLFGGRGSVTLDVTTASESVSAMLAKCLIRLAPRAGFEPATIRLTVGCSTAELPRNKRYTSSRAAAYNKASSACIGRNGGLHRPRNAGRKAWFGKALPVRIATRKRRSRITFHAECHPATRHSFDAKWTHLPQSFRAAGSRR